MALQRGLNVTELLDQRSRGGKAALNRLNLKILRGILLQDNRRFVEVWLKTSKSPIMYENGNIYFHNYLDCYSCIDHKPRQLYSLAKRSKQEKFEDALLCQSPLEETLPCPSDHKPSLLTLTANNWLYRLSAETGKELQKVYLSPKYKFRYLCWDVSQETFYAKSVQSKETPSQRQTGSSSSTALQLAIFNVFPLQVLGVLEINRKGFGNGVTDAVLSQGVLAVSHSNMSVKLYSFEHIYLKEKLTLGKECSLGNSTVGDFPFGIPLNIHCTDSPPVLFEVSCYRNGVQIGGYPWHYIFTLPQTRHRGTYHICSLQNKTMATNGVRNMNNSSLECDRIFFHPDDSGRIIHIGPTTIKCDILSTFTLKCSCIFFGLFLQPPAQFTVTLSGRTVKSRVQRLDDDSNQETFRTIEYEDELDLLAVVVTNKEEEEGKACVRLHDNQSGFWQRTIDLVESWDETYGHQLFFDKDTIVHIEERKNKFCCHVYKLRTVRKRDVEETSDVQ
uniref:DDB1- and CUL4-associated factor 17 n=1 Tax=Gouania willdenowi TaxID=441366 RepID=A0A8C5DUN7_GOUWI